MTNLPTRYTPKNSQAGGMSSILLCVDNKLQRDVIVKSLDPQTDQQRLLDEVQALQSIRSAYVVQIYDVITDDNGDIVSVVEEFCAGSDLSDRIGKITSEEFVRFGYQLISGIHEVHEHGIVHRDIKPHNVRVGDLGRLTIIDFGLARLIDGAKTVSKIGTSGFMAPELFVENSSGSIDFTSSIDVFAFASSMYLLAVGSLPANLRKRPPQMDGHGADFYSLPWPIDHQLANLLTGCFANNPKDRPSAEELRNSFRRILLRGRHRALINIANSPKYLDSNNPKATASISGLASVVIEYDGDNFIATSVTGDLFINAAKVSNGYQFPGSCVIAFGGPELQAQRVFITFDVSHPGVEI